MPHRVECPECAAVIQLADDVLEGEITQCAECGVELETILRDGAVAVQPAPEEEEDWGE
ncbi:MAG TPA: lysine biosynthesis protein LysW [Gemmatimonadales bacterium]|nr:lysine biosynthesis protein LysW [Gemmatimonadales bacterium]